MLRSKLRKVAINMYGRLTNSEISVTKVIAHGVVGVGTLLRCVRVTENLGRSLTPLDLGIMTAAFIFEATRLEIGLRLLLPVKR